jgi:hypothetical protein
VQANPIRPASAASLAYGAATSICQSRTAAATIPRRSRARSIHHRIARRRARPATAVTIEEQGAVCLAEHADPRARVQLALAVESGQDSERGDPVVGVPAKLGVDEESGQPLSIHGSQLKALEGDGKAAL